MAFPLWTFGNAAEDRLKKFHQSDWKGALLEEKAEELKAIQQQAEDIADFRTQFAAGLVLMDMYSGRSIPQFNEELVTLDSLFDVHYKELPDSSLLDFFINKGTGLLLQGYFPEALRNLQYAQILAEDAGNSDFTIRAKNGMGMYHMMKRDVGKALALAIEVVEEFESRPIADTNLWITYLGNLGVTYSWNRMYDSSNVYLHKAIALDLGSQEGVSTRHYYLGENFLQLHRYDSSEYYLREAIAIESANNPGSSFIYTLNQHLGKLFAVKGDFQRSNAFFGQTLQPLDSLGMYDQLVYANGKMLVNNLKARKDTSSMNRFQGYQIAQDSIRMRNNANLEQKYLVQFETLEKEAEIRDLELQQQKDQNAKLLLGILCGGALLLLTFGVFRFRTQRTLSRQRLALKEMEAARAKEELRKKESELAEKINHLQVRDQVIDELKSKIESHSATKDIIGILEQNYIKDQSWDHIILQFETLYPEMFSELRKRSQKISPNDLKMSILMRLGYSTNSIAEILKISKEGVRKARQRLKDKVGADFVQRISA